MAAEKNNTLLKIAVAIVTVILIISFIYFIFKSPTQSTDDVYIGEVIGVPPVYLGCNSNIVATIYKKGKNWEKERLQPFNTTPAFYVLNGGNPNNIFGITPGTTTFSTYPTVNKTILPCLLNTAFSWGILNRTPWAMQITFPFNYYQTKKSANQTVLIEPFSYTYVNDPNLKNLPAGVTYLPMFMYQNISYKFIGKNNQVIPCSSDNGDSCDFSCPQDCAGINPATGYLVMQFDVFQDKSNPIKRTIFKCHRAVAIADIPAYSGAPIPTPIELFQYYSQGGGFLNMNNKLPTGLYVMNGKLVRGYVTQSSVLEPNIAAAVPWVLNYSVASGTSNTRPPIVTLEAIYSDQNGNELNVVIGVATPICPSPCLYETFDVNGGKSSSCGHGGMFTYKYSCLTCPPQSGCGSPGNPMPSNFIINSDTCAKNLDVCNLDTTNTGITGTTINWLQSHLSGASYIYNEMLPAGDATFSLWQGGVNNGSIPVDTPIPLYVGQKFNIGYSYLDSSGKIVKTYAFPSGAFVPLNTYSVNGLLEMNISGDFSTSTISLNPPTITNKIILGRNGLALPINLKFLESLISDISTRFYFNASNSGNIIPSWSCKGSGSACSGKLQCNRTSCGGPCSIPMAVTGAPKPLNNGTLFGVGSIFEFQWAIFATDSTGSTNSNPVWFCDFPNPSGSVGGQYMKLVMCNTYRANIYMNSINGACWRARVPFLIKPKNGNFGPIVKYDLTMNWDTLTWIMAINSESAMKSLISSLQKGYSIKFSFSLKYIPYSVAVLGSPPYIITDNDGSGTDYFTRCSTDDGNKTGNGGSTTRFEFIQGWVFEVSYIVGTIGGSNLCAGIGYTKSDGETCTAVMPANIISNTCGSITLPPEVTIPASVFTGCT